MDFLITGGTGFIGRELRTRLLREGHLVKVLTRFPEKYESEAAKNQQFIGWDGDLSTHMEQVDVVINLVGETLFGLRWTETVKKRIYSSRIDNTNKLTKAMAKAVNPPKLLVSVSGVDYYDDGGSEIQDEEYPPGNGFLSKMCIDWEDAALKAKEIGVRVAVARQGVVLEQGGGALRLMLPTFRLFAGGSIGSGEQFLSWIHMHDVCRGLLYPVENESFDGVYNLCSPNPVTMDEFTDTLGDVLNRPSFFRVPEFALKLVLGEAATPVLNSHRTQPKRLQQVGFNFEFEDLHVALSDIL